MHPKFEGRANKQANILFEDFVDAAANDRERGKVGMGITPHVMSISSDRLIVYCQSYKGGILICAEVAEHAELGRLQYEIAHPDELPQRVATFQADRQQSFLRNHVPADNPALAILERCLRYLLDHHGPSPSTSDAGRKGKIVQLFASQ